MKPYRFTAEERERMIDAGIVTEDDSIQSANGEALEKMPAGDPHIACMLRITRKFARVLDDSIFVSVQNPIRLSVSEPEPDFALLRYRDDFYATRKARPADILLLIEVAYSSLDFDREVKAPLYAADGIVEYWIVNLVDDCLEVCRSPQADRRYADKQILRRGQQIEIQAVPGVVFEVADLLNSGPPQP
jgi:Uma2 family endonuclease